MSNIDEEPTPCYYQCYCQKIYRSFTGIYLHIKFKHSQLFYKYDVEENLTRIEVNNKCVYRVNDIAACDKMDRKSEFQGKGFRKKAKQGENGQLIEETKRLEGKVKNCEESQDSLQRKKRKKGNAKISDQ